MDVILYYIRQKQGYLLEKSDDSATCGNTIINSIVPLALEGKATTEYAPAGFRWVFEIAATHIVEDMDRE